MLSPKERWVLLFASKGLDNTQIGRLMRVSPRMVGVFLDNARYKLSSR